MRSYSSTWGKLHIRQTDFANCPGNENNNTKLLFHMNCLSTSEKQAADVGVERLLEVGVVVESEHEDNKFVSTIFSVKMKDGSHRMILNLAKLNEFVNTVISKWTH